VEKMHGILLIEEQLADQKSGLIDHGEVKQVV
jgi:hypothetical protein